MKINFLGLIIIAVSIVSCKKDPAIDVLGANYGCHGFAQKEYTFTVTPDTKSISIGTWRKLDANHNIEGEDKNISGIYCLDESTAEKGVHYKSESPDEDWINFHTTFAEGKTTSTVEIELIPENITKPVFFYLAYSIRHLDARPTDFGQIFDLTTKVRINLVPGE